jgi:ABC-type proline/glycine betaine transport system permease subunit
MVAIALLAAAVLVIASMLLPETLGRPVGQGISQRRWSWADAASVLRS